MLLRVLNWKSAPINVTKKTKLNKNEYIICSGNSYKYLIRFENLQTQFWSIRRLNYKICFNQLTATYFFFPKKHMPMLFHKWGDSGVAAAAILYLVSATS